MFQVEHELHRRRRGRNSSVGLLLGGFVLLVFAVTLVKLSQGHMMQDRDRPAGSATP